MFTTRRGCAATRRSFIETGNKHPNVEQTFPTSATVAMETATTTCSCFLKPHKRHLTNFQRFRPDGSVSLPSLAQTRRFSEETITTASWQPLTRHPTVLRFNWLEAWSSGHLVLRPTDQSDQAESVRSNDTTTLTMLKFLAMLTTTAMCPSD